MHFASDNTSPAHPNVLAALTEANTGYVSSYGSDAITAEVEEMIRDLFEAPEASVHLVATGSAANALGLSLLAKPWETIFCHRVAHIEEDECGAPEFYIGGGKLCLVEGQDAKMSPDALEAAITFTGRSGVHNHQRGALSLTNVTEHGTVYTTEEVAKLTSIAKRHNLPCHMDGARFANAIAATGATPAEMTWKAGIDVLSFGGTKNGLMGVEAVVVFDPEMAWEFALRRKRGGHLFSKHRYLAAQMQAYLKDDLWLTLARHANDMARRLSEGICEIDGTALVHPTEANLVFAQWSRGLHHTLHDAGAEYYLWPSNQRMDGDENEALAARLVASWSTTPEDVDHFLKLMRG